MLQPVQPDEPVQQEFPQKHSSLPSERERMTNTQFNQNVGNNLNSSGCPLKVMLKYQSSGFTGYYLTPSNEIKSVQYNQPKDESDHLIFSIKFGHPMMMCIDDEKINSIEIIPIKWEEKVLKILISAEDSDCFEKINFLS